MSPPLYSPNHFPEMRVYIWLHQNTALNKKHSLSSDTDHYRRREEMHHVRLCLRPQARVKMTPTGSINQDVTSAAALAPTLPTLPRQPPPRQLTRGAELGRHSCTSLALGPDLPRKQTACHHHGDRYDSSGGMWGVISPKCNTLLNSSGLLCHSQRLVTFFFPILSFLSSLFRLKTRTPRATFNRLLYVPLRHTEHFSPFKSTFL